MSIFSRTTSQPPAATYADDPTRIELWVPERLASHFHTLRPEIARALSPLTEREWADELTQALPPHVRRALAATAYGGVDPTKMERPQVPISTTVQVPVLGTRTNADEPARLLGSKMEASGASSDDIARIRAWRDTIAQAPEFEATAAAAVEAVLADPGRAWEAFLHLRVLEAADAQVTADEATAREQRAFEAQARCPICGAADRSEGQLVERFLDTGETVRRVPSAVGTLVPPRRATVVRGHAKCVQEVLRQSAEAAALDRVGDGRTRREAAAAWLAQAR